MPTHTRIRMFNTKATYPNQTLDNDLCQAVRAGNTIYVRGQVGTDFEGRLVGLGDPRAQAEQAMKNVKQLLEEAGSDLSHIVKTTTTSPTHVSASRCTRKSANGSRACSRFPPAW